MTSREAINRIGIYGLSMTVREGLAGSLIFVLSLENGEELQVLYRDNGGFLDDDEVWISKDSTKVKDASLSDIRNEAMRRFSSKNT